jgi:hypothetical protein
VQENEFASLKARLHRQGWTVGADGSWTAPGRGAALGGVEAGRAEQAPARALDGGRPERVGGSCGVAARVVLVAYRHRRLDPDAVAFSFKPLTDAVASTLGVDDDDPRVEWEWRQVQTDGAEGVAVRVEEVERKTAGKVKLKKVENSF